MADGGGTIEYRMLRPSELDAWFDFVALVFGPKGTPRDYFVAHFYNDPYASVDSILVALHVPLSSSSAPSFAVPPTDRRQRIVGTVRVFSRSMYVRGTPVHFGGIGEVSVHEDLRHRGIACRLLQLSKELMTTRNADAKDKHPRYVLSVLHTGPQAPLYERCGWWNTEVRTSSVLLHAHWALSVSPPDSTRGIHKEPASLRLPPGWRVQSADFSDDALLQKLAATHQAWCQHYQVTGPVCRDVGYFRRWVAREAHAHQCAGLLVLSNDQFPDVPCAYLIARAKPNQIRPSSTEQFALSAQVSDSDPLQIELYVKEFIWDPSSCHSTATEATSSPKARLWQLVGYLLSSTETCRTAALSHHPFAPGQALVDINMALELKISSVTLDLMASPSGSSKEESVSSNSSSKINAKSNPNVEAATAPELSLSTTVVASPNTAFVAAPSSSATLPVTDTGSGVLSSWHVSSAPSSVSSPFSSTSMPRHSEAETTRFGFMYQIISTNELRTTAAQGIVDKESLEMELNTRQIFFGTDGF